MTYESESTGARLARLRRAQNITQEALAERLGVSRQAVSKWESDLAYPETDKLLRLSRLYGVTVDYLLTGETPTAVPHTTQKVPSEPSTKAASTPLDTPVRDTATATENTAKTKKNAKITVTATVDPPGKTGAQPEENSDIFGSILDSWANRWRHFEFKSRRTLGGLPLVHINLGRGRTATGVLAIGLTARGVVAIGLAAVGVLAIGLASVGLLSVGLAALGLLLAVGTVAVGAVAIGAIAVGLLAIGALSVGLISTGALAVGRYLAIGDHAYGGMAIGRTLAEGECFAYEGALSLPAVELEQAQSLVETHVPRGLRALARLILRAICR